MREFSKEEIKASIPMPTEFVPADFPDPLGIGSDFQMERIASAFERIASSVERMLGIVEWMKEVVIEEMEKDK